MHPTFHPGWWFVHSPLPLIHLPPQVPITTSSHPKHTHLDPDHQHANHVNPGQDQQANCQAGKKDSNTTLKPRRARGKDGTMTARQALNLPAKPEILSKILGFNTGTHLINKRSKTKTQNGKTRGICWRVSQIRTPKLSKGMTRSVKTIWQTTMKAISRLIRMTALVGADSRHLQWSFTIASNVLWAPRALPYVVAPAPTASIVHHA